MGFDLPKNIMRCGDIWFSIPIESMDGEDMFDLFAHTTYARLHVDIALSNGEFMEDTIAEQYELAISSIARLRNKINDMLELKYKPLFFNAGIKWDDAVDALLRIFEYSEEEGFVYSMSTMEYDFICMVLDVAGRSEFTPEKLLIKRAPMPMFI